MPIRHFVGGVGIGFDAGGKTVAGDHADNFLDHCFGRAVVADVQMNLKIIQPLGEARPQLANNFLR